MRNSIEQSVTQSLSESIASSIRAELESCGALAGSLMTLSEQPGASPPTPLSEAMPNEIAQQTEMLKAQMDALQEELQNQRSQLEGRIVHTEERVAAAARVNDEVVSMPAERYQ